MARLSKTPTIAAFALLFVAACAFLALLVLPGFRVNVRFEELDTLQVGDRVYMNGQRIGEVLDTELKASEECIVNLAIDRKYRHLINRSTVFRIARDQFIAGRKCVLSKNCDDDARGVESGYTFQGYGWLGYQAACVAGAARSYWEEELRDSLTTSMEKLGEISEELYQKLEDWGRESPEELKRFLDEWERELKNAPPKVRKQLDNARDAIKI